MELICEMMTNENNVWEKRDHMAVSAASLPPQRRPCICWFICWVNMITEVGKCIKNNCLDLAGDPGHHLDANLFHFVSLS